MKQNHLARLEDLVKDGSAPEVKKRLLNYANYTKENYNILTLEKHNNYYQNYQQKIPVYVREQPDWSKSLYKRKSNKVNKHNYILFRNVQNLRHPKSHSRSIQNVPRDSLYRVNKSFAEKSNVNKTVAMSRKGERSVTNTLPPISRAVTTQKHSSFCGSKSNGKSSKTGGVLEAEQLIKRAEQLGKFIQGVKTEEGKEVARSYGKELIAKLKASDITKERMRIAMCASADELQKAIEERLGIELDVDAEEYEAAENQPSEEVDDSKCVLIIAIGPRYKSSRTKLPSSTPK
eukprot:TRINITY_DN13868_c0_g1_i12.p1 TRINITY_DN13868_c0_g1~~TRINITY_DN13868_c0_g1_i12.p1  ORF type:complete len:290 (-),score=64.79 TRINITY_DN13868_c0_g1_i12:365-1234(-)